MEATYEYLAVLIQISGTWPPVTPVQARAAIASRFGIPLDEQLEIHAAAAPFDFFLILPDCAANLEVVSGNRIVQMPEFTLTIRPWNRLVYADHGALYHKVQIEIEGIPPHIWQESTAIELLRPYCSVISIHLDTVA